MLKIKTGKVTYATLKAKNLMKENCGP